MDKSLDTLSNTDDHMIDSLEERFELPAIADEERNTQTPEKQGRFARMCNKLGYYAARVTMAGYNTQSAIAEKIQTRNEAKLEQTDDAAEKETSRWSRLKRHVGRAAIVAGSFVGLAAASYLTQKAGAETPQFAGIRHAVDTQILVSGRGDGAGQGITSWFNDFHNPNQVEVIQYQGGISPVIGDSATFNQSKATAGQGVYDALMAGDGGDNPVGYSLGTAGALEGANRYVAETGNSVSLDMVGGPYGEGGFFHNPYVQALKPVFGAMDIDVSTPPLPPGTTVYGNPNDIWVNGSSANPLTLASNALGTAFGGTHGYNTEILSDTANQTSFIGSDGVRYVTIHDDLSGAGHAALANGLQWSPEAEHLTDVLAPVGEIGKPAPDVNWAQAPEAIANAVESVARDNGIPIDIPPIPEIPQMPSVPDTAQGLIDQWTAPAPAETWTPPVAEWTPPVEAAPVVNQVQEWVAPIQEVIDTYVPPAASTPDIAQQVNQVFEQPQVQQVVNDINTQIQNSPLGQFLPR